MKAREVDRIMAEVTAAALRADAQDVMEGRGTFEPRRCVDCDSRPAGEDMRCPKCNGEPAEPIGTAAARQGHLQTASMLRRMAKSARLEGSYFARMLEEDAAWHERLAAFLGSEEP